MNRSWLRFGAGSARTAGATSSRSRDVQTLPVPSADGRSSASCSSSSRQASGAAPVPCVSMNSDCRPDTNARVKSRLLATLLVGLSTAVFLPHARDLDPHAALSLILGDGSAPSDQRGSPRVSDPEANEHYSMASTYLAGVEGAFKSDWNAAGDSISHVLHRHPEPLCGHLQFLSEMIQ